MKERAVERAKEVESTEPAERMADVVRLVEQIRPILAGQGPWCQGAVLADLVAIWLAGHTLGDPKQDDELRANLLTVHIEMVKKLVPVNVGIIAARAVQKL